jgi:hypothetical protein
MTRFFLILISLSLFTCTTSIDLDIKEVYPQDSEPDQQNGYIFGKLAIKSTNGNFALEFLNLDNPSEGTIIISFLKYTDNINSAGITLVPVQPGTYRLKNVLYLIGKNKLYSQKEVTMKDVTEEFTVEAGNCCYIGHWFAHFSEENTPEGQSVVWELDSITDQSELAFKEVFEQYPLFSGMEFITFFPETE